MFSAPALPLIIKLLCTLRVVIATCKVHNLLIINPRKFFLQLNVYYEDGLKFFAYLAIEILSHEKE